MRLKVVKNTFFKKYKTNCEHYKSLCDNLVTNFRSKRNKHVKTVFSKFDMDFTHAPDNGCIVEINRF